MIVHETSQNNFEPEYGAIDQKFGSLPIDFEIDTRDLADAGKNEERIYHLYKRAALSALIHVGKKYDLPVETLEEELCQSEIALSDCKSN